MDQSEIVRSRWQNKFPCWIRVSFWGWVGVLTCRHKRAIIRALDLILRSCKPLQRIRQGIERQNVSLDSDGGHEVILQIKIVEDEIRRKAKLKECERMNIYT